MLRALIVDRAGSGGRMRFGLARAAVITAIACAGTTVLVGSPAGASATSASPNVSVIGTAAGPVAGGTRVTVYGTHFTQVRSVRFGNVDGTALHVVSSTELKITAPKHPAGEVNVRVRTQHGISPVATTDLFQYLARPTVTAVDPASGPQSGMNTVTIRGTGFDHVRGVLFGTKGSLTWHRRSSTRLSVVVPGQNPGTVDVRVENPVGTSARSAQDRFTYVLPPDVTGVSPSAGALSGGERVLVRGHRFDGVSAVRFGGVDGTDLTVLSHAALQVTAPPGAAGPVDVTVEGSYGTSGPTSADSYSYVAAPAVPTVATVAAPGPFAADSSEGVHLSDTGCTAATCYAVGQYETSQAVVPVIETLTDGTWTEAYAPLPTDAIGPVLAELSAISCTPGGCVAVGDYMTKLGRDRPLIESFDGSTWIASTTTAGSLDDAAFDEVACGATGGSSACVATGESDGPILARGSGGTWTAVAVPSPPGVTVTGVSEVSLACGSADYCVFVGMYSVAGDNNSHAFGVTYQAGTWTAAALPAPADGASDSLFLDAGCPSVDQCVGVGYYDNADGTAFHALIATDTDGAWSTVAAPVPADAVTGTDAVTRLEAISCAAGRCTATGEYATAQANAGFVDTLESGYWSTRPVADPDAAAGTFRDLDGAACVSADQCVLVGSDRPATGSTVGVAGVAGPGGTAEAQVPLPDGVTDADQTVSNVSCSSSGVCAAIAVARPTGQTTPAQWALVTVEP